MSSNDGVPQFALNFGSSILQKKNALEGTEEIVPEPKPAVRKLELKEKIKVPIFDSVFADTKQVRLSDGKVIDIHKKAKSILTRNETKTAKSFGVNIHRLYETLEKEQSEEKPQKKHKKKHNHGGALWVEKWRPQNFVDLVGNERANRFALRWLKHWSTAVYGEDISKELSELKGYKRDENAEADPFNRPFKRILLLHGPPGVGKTSTAHLITKLLKYDAIEINASDERAGQHVKDKIYSALDNHTFSGRPACVIADEVDGGAENGFIKTLVDLVYKDARATKNLINKKVGRNDRLLLRPIVAICNELYSPVLEKLRPHCEIVGFKPAPFNSVKEKLQHVCEKENLNISQKGLQQVVVLGNSDIRSCLNLLQFDGSRLSEDIDASRLKDLTYNWFELVERVFRLNLHESKSATFFKLQKALAGTGSIEKIVNGCFQKYPENVYEDPELLNKSNAVGDWLFFYDRMLSNKYQQNSDLLGYCNLVPLKFNTLFAEAQKTKLSRNNSSWENHELFRANFDICQRALNNSRIKATTFTLLNKKLHMATEILPILNNYIFNPVLSGQNSVILSNPADRKKVEHLLALMKDLDFSIEKPETTSRYDELILLPLLDSVASFQPASEYNSTDSRRQQLLRYLNYELERKIQAVNLKRKLPEIVPEKDTKVPRNNGSVDFFKSSYAAVGQTQEKQVSLEDLKVWVKYHEGFSNAVRKNMTWEDLWKF